ncbi:DUF6035 family protein [Aquimarina sp. RZ0]|uniref:DUF6035 family protein n=1 Tax=Aquimarina sp. RZ0 TaxID=2607730 RepID=UPI0011F23D15|nr:DUF6035 family protein [Aquimarina sp. RZ0]KAA1242596.1 hypothetical protein F0000_24930 [Aquimarina sp. RZ0]
MAFERSIKSAIIKETGEIIQSDDYFKNKQNGDEIRTEYNRSNITFLCLECKQKLSLSKSNKRTFYLKHFPNSEYCELKEESLSIREQEVYNEILIAKESPRHIFLKNKIGELLKETKDVSEVKIDQYFIFNDKGEKRRPDVYCKYLDKEIVFEIQLSNLSQKYILGRHDFYKAKGMYLIWILDNFDVEGNTTTELDIKYLFKHQNYFRFRDASNFRLNCKFKQTHLNAINQFYDKWNEVDITLDKLQFDERNNEVYFYNFLKNKNEVQVIQKRNQIVLEKTRKEKEEQKEQDRIAYEIHNFIQAIGNEKEKYKPNFNRLKKKLNNYEEAEIEFLNQKLKLDERGKLFIWFEKSSESDYDFLRFILGSYDIDLDVNKTNKSGQNVFYYLFNNDEIYQKEKFLKLLFRRGFKFEKKDHSILKDYFKDSYDNFQRSNLVFELANNTPKWLIDTLFEYKSQRVLCVIESCLNKKIVGFKIKGWIALFNYAIHNFSEYWEYIEKALKSNNLFDEMIAIDKKGTFQNKLKKHNNSQLEHNRDFNDLFQHLYPELCH